MRKAAKAAARLAPHEGQRLLTLQDMESKNSARQLSQTIRAKPASGTPQSREDEEQAIRGIPWGTILMVSGVTVLIALLEKTGGMDLFTQILARVSTPSNVTGVIAFVTGLISVYSSSSGVVLPAFLPTIPGLIENLGGGDPLAIAASINVGAHLVDVSPLSTLGALCMASAPPTEDRRALFNKLLLWGLSMSVVGALVCYLFFGVLGLAG